MIHLSRDNWVLTNHAQADAIHLMDGSGCDVENYDEGWMKLIVKVPVDLGDYAMIMDRLKNSFPRYRLLSVSTLEVTYAVELGVENVPASTWEEDWKAWWAKTDGHCPCGSDGCNGNCRDSYPELDGEE